MSEGGEGSGQQAPSPVLGADVRARVEEYLSRVDAALVRRGIRPVERNHVTTSLRQRVDHALAARSAQSPARAAPTLADADAVLATLGPPERHASPAPRSTTPVPPAPAQRAQRPPAPGTASAPAAVPRNPEAQSPAPLGYAPRSTPHGSPRLSLMALTGAIWASLFFVMIVLSFVQIELPAGESTPLWVLLLQYVFQPLGLAAPFATTVLGLIAIGQIHRSAGTQYGLSLALFDALLFPLLLLDFILFWTFGQIAKTFVQQDLLSNAVASTLIHQMLATAVVVMVDYWLVRRAWAAVQLKPREVHAVAGGAAAAPPPPRTPPE